MANGGKDIKFGHDKRPITLVEGTEQNLFNIANGEILTDEFGTPLITEVDTFFLKDASADRSTSVSFPKDRRTAYTRGESQVVGIHTANYGVTGKIVSIGLPFTVRKTDNSVVTTSSSIRDTSNTLIPFDSATINIVGVGTTVAVLTRTEITKVVASGGDGDVIVFNSSVGISTIVGVKVGDSVSGKGIPEGTRVTRVKKDAVFINSKTTGVSNVNLPVEFRRYVEAVKLAQQSWKIQESFRETSEVSTTLLGVNRAETQLSLFSNVSSYGLESDSFEFYSDNGGNNFASWDNRQNATYGKRYNARLSEETQESGIRLEAFPTPYSYPFGPKFEKYGLYSQDAHQKYKDFVTLGNQLYNYFDSGDGASLGYPADWKDKFLNPNTATIVGLDVGYPQGFQSGFYNVDIWTDTWRDISQSQLTDPVTAETFNFARVNALLGSSYASDNTRPGYTSNQKRYAYLQSRRVFRYQPGRISGFTFGLRSSVEPREGAILEWGVKNPTDQYVFRIVAGQLSIVRRSTVPLSSDVLARNGLSITDQEENPSGNPFDSKEYYTINIPRDNFNGDPLNGNGPSGWNIQPENVTMYKIEFGWYGAIGARFYVYIPEGNGGARWIPVHTLIIENQLESPCLQDSYFRLVYSLNIFNTENLRTPQFLYKYGASYYIDGGDEGTVNIFSVSSGQKTIIGSGDRTMLGITPKNLILSSAGEEIANKKLIIPTLTAFTSDSLAKVQVKTCKACPGFGHVYTPGVASTVFDPDRNFEMRFDATGNKVSAINTSVFRLTDVDSKVIAPTIYNAYISEIDLESEIGNTGTYQSAVIKGLGPGLTGNPGSYDSNRPLAGSDVTVVHATTGVTATVNLDATYPESVRLSNYNGYAASDFPLTGSKIEIQFMNPSASDLGHFSDFIVGLTDAVPQVAFPNVLTGFNYDNLTNQTTLPNNKILFGEHSHSFATFNEDGDEIGEGRAGSLRMEMDRRIPTVSGAGGGKCSKVDITILEPIPTVNVNELTGTEMVANFPESGVNPLSTDRFLLVEGSFPSGVDYDGGQIAFDANDGNGIQVSNSRYVGTVGTFTKFQGGSNVVFQFIQINQSLSIASSNFSVFIRPVKIEGQNIPTKQKLYNYIPFPLFLVIKLRDNAAINNITIKETIGDSQKTVSPRLYILGDHMEVTTAGGNADPNSLPPTNFKSVGRLSSALFDTQNEQNLRPSTLRDSFFVGANQTKVIDMSPIFGADRNVITPDNNNLEATFFTARKLDGAFGNIETTVTFKEQ